MGLHCDMGVQVVKRPIRLLTPIPSALVHALNFLVSSPRPLVLLSSGNWDEGVDLQEETMY